MSEDNTSVEKQQTSILSQHRFMLLVAITILISLFLVGVSLALYKSSGAAALDLSRPGYVSVRQQATQTDQTDDSFNGFTASGPVTKAGLDQFRQLYNQEVQKVNSVDAFNDDAMSDQSLSIDDPSTVTTTPLPTTQTQPQQ